MRSLGGARRTQVEAFGTALRHHRLFSTPEEPEPGISDCKSYCCPAANVPGTLPRTALI